MKRPPFALEGIDHVLLLVRGMERSLAFYTDVIGCAVQDRLPEFGMAQLRAGAALIDLVDVEAAEGAWARPREVEGRNLDHLALAIGPVSEAALRWHLAERAVEIVEEGVHAGARGESLSSYVRDPSGNTIELKPPPEAG